MKKILFIILLSLPTFSHANVGIELGKFFAINGVPENLTTKELQLICEKGTSESLCRMYADSLGKAICLSASISTTTCDLYANTVPKGICLAGGASGTICNLYADNLAKGICLAGGTSGTTCNLYADSPAKGICLAGGLSGTTCNLYAQTLPAGICLAKGGEQYECRNISIDDANKMEVNDVDWAWDKFTNPNSYNRIWACRGKQTGRFADDLKCIGKVKFDDTWPNN